MALGNTYSGNQGIRGSYSNTNQNNTMYNPTYYSRLSIKNPVDNLRLSFNYWNGTLRIAISEAGTAQDGRNNELAYIHLSPTKASLFSECVEKIMADRESSNIFGVDTGTGETHGLIAIGREMGIPYLIIAKVNSNGNYESNQRFNFNNNYQYFLSITDIQKLSFKKNYDNIIELAQFRDLLVDFARASSGAYGAAFYDIGRYEAAKSSNLIRAISEKVNATTKGNGGYSNNSYFSNNNNSSNNGSTGKSDKGSYRITNLEDELD